MIVHFFTPPWRFLLLCSLIVSLAACGGGEDPYTTNEPQQEPSFESPTSLSPNQAHFLHLLNTTRLAGFNCPSGSFAPTAPLQVHPILSQAALHHAQDMARHDFAARTNLQGLKPVDRAVALGFTSRYVGETLAAGFDSAQRTLDALLASDGHCTLLMNPRFTHIGVAAHFDPQSIYKHYWVQVLGTP